MAEVVVSHNIFRIQDFEGSHRPGGRPPNPGNPNNMAAVVLSHNITRQEDFEGSPPGSLSSVGSGPGAGFAAGLHYEGLQCVQRRINTTGSDHGFMYVHNTTIDLLGAGNTVTLAKSYTVLGGSLTEQKFRIGSATGAYHEYLIGDDGTEGDNQDFLVSPRGGYILIPIEARKTAWINRGITGSPDITVNDVWGTTFNVTATTGAGDSSAMDSIDLTDDGFFLVGGDGADADGIFADFLDADEGAGLTGASRAGLWTSQAGIFFTFGKHVIGRTDAGTVTATVFTDLLQTIVFPGGFVGAGFNGFEFDLGNATTAITLDNVTIQGRGRSDIKRYFDTARDVTGGATDEIQIIGHGFNTGDQVEYSAEGGSDDIGPDATNGQSEDVTSAGPGTGPMWYVSVVDADTIQLHPTASDAFAGTSIEGLTAATAPGENHSLRRRPDTRFDLDFTGTLGSADFTSCTFQGFREINLTSPVVLDTVNLVGGQFLDFGSATVRDCVIDGPTVPIGEAFMDIASVLDLVDVDDNTWNSGGEGHAIRATTTGGTVAFVGNVFNGYGPDRADFDTITDIASNIITLSHDDFVTGDPVYYSDEGLSDSVGLTDNALYYVRRTGANTVSIHPSARAANDNTDVITLNDGATGQEHALYSANAAFWNDTGSAITINVSGGGNAFSVRNTSGSTTTVNLTTTLTITGIPGTGVGGGSEALDSEVRIYQAGTTIEEAGIENNSDGDFDYSYTPPTGFNVDIVILNLDFEYFKLSNVVLPAADSDLPVVLRPDRNFSNP